MKKIYLTIFTAILLMANVFAQCPGSIALSPTTVSPASCPSNGSFTINATVGTGVVYQITNGPTGFPTGAQNTPTFSALLPGTYTVKVSCQANLAIFTTTTFTIPSTYVQVAANSVVSNVCSANAPNATITTTVTAGSSSPFTYAYWQGDPAIADGSLTYSSSNIYTASAFGTYNVRTKDACGVFVTQQVTVANPYPDNLCVTSVYFSNETLNCAQLQNSIWSRFVLGNNIPFSLLPSTGIDIDVYINTGTCASPVQGALVSTQHYDNTSSNNSILVPRGVNLLYVVRTPCGTSCTYCYTYNPANSAFSQNAYLVAKGCVPAGSPITYSLIIDQNVFFATFPINYVIKNSAGTVVATYTANSLADLAHEFTGLQADTYTMTATDACLKQSIATLSPPTGTPNQLAVVYSETYTGCTSIEGRTSLKVLIQGVMANFANAIATIVAPSPTLVGTTYQNPNGFYDIQNLIPGATYYFEIDNLCGQKVTVPVVVPSTVPQILVQHTFGTVQQLCGGAGNIIVDAAYNGWGSFTYQITNSVGTVVGTGGTPGGTYSNLPAGTYTITTTVNGCAAVYSYSSQVTILPGGSGPQIIKKLGVICEDAAGNPTGTGSAIFSFIGAKDLKVDYKLSSQPDADYINLTNASDGSETIGGLLANTSYTIRITDNCGKSTVSEIAIGRLSPLATTSSAQPCPGVPYTLAVPDMVDATYTWKKNGVPISTNREIIFPSYSAGDNGVYVCTVSIAGGCVTRTVTVTLNSLLCGQMISLPIKLSEFTVQKIGNSAKISWSTEEEINSSYFNIERSIDGINWNTIATVNAANNSSQRIDYSIADNAPVKGINYYRLKSVDRDTKYTYSPVKTALFKSAYTIEVAPNPAKNIVHVYIAKTGTQAAKVQLLNVNGTVIYNTTSSQSHIQIDVSGISKGLYFVKVMEADTVTVLRVVVE